MIEHSRSEIFKAWFNIVFDKVEILLLLGFGAVLLSPWVDCLRLDQAGALLTAAAIIATVFHQNNTDQMDKHLKDLTGEPFDTFLFYQEKNPATNNIIWKKGMTKSVKLEMHQVLPDVYIIDPTRSPWYIISKKRVDKDGLIHWIPKVTIKRVNDIETWCIAISALIGTFLWAFGNQITI